MVKTRKTEKSPSTNRSRRSNKPASKKLNAGDKQTKSTDPATEVNGDCGNGKVRCKSLVIDGTKYRTRLNQKFEARKSYERPDFRNIISMIPGTILKIMVQEGQAVKQGDQMLVLEAMKMKNRILFHSDGVVKSIHVKEGEKISKDHLMVVME